MLGDGGACDIQPPGLVDFGLKLDPKTTEKESEYAHG